jgi:hypothetical protein
MDSISYSLRSARDRNVPLALFPAETSTRRRREKPKEDFRFKRSLQTAILKHEGGILGGGVLPPSKLEFFCFLGWRK